MIRPAAFVYTSVQNQPSTPEQLGTGKIIPREIIILGSSLTILGLVGLSIQGFRMFKEFDREETRSN